jgi:protein gp37
MKDTAISWAHHTINFWRGCSKVSAECKNCYAETIMEKIMGEDFATRAFRFEAAKKEALKFNAAAAKEGKRYVIFTLSMGDFFDPLGDEIRPQVWDVIRQTPYIDWMILTKRPQLIVDRLPKDWGDQGWANVWLGTTCGTRRKYRCEYSGEWMTPFDRVDILRKIPARIRFISAEPLLEDISDLDLTGIHWLAAGGESGPEWDVPGRTMNISWAANLYDRCVANDTAFLFKQVSARKSEHGVNALNLYLAERDGVRIDPRTCELIRQWPVQYLDHELMPFDEVGENHPARLGMYDWKSYKGGLVMITIGAA